MTAACAHVCALADPRAALTFDQPEIQQVRRDALAWWIGQLGDALVCLTTLALDESRYGGAITVTRAPVSFHDDPFANLPGNRRPQRRVLLGGAAHRTGRGAICRGALAGRDIRRTLITPAVAEPFRDPPGPTGHRPQRRPHAKGTREKRRRPMA